MGRYYIQIYIFINIFINIVSTHHNYIYIENVCVINVYL